MHALLALGSLVFLYETVFRPVSWAFCGPCVLALQEIWILVFSALLCTTVHTRTCVSLRGLRGRIFTPFPHEGGLWQMTSGTSFVSVRCLVQQRIPALRQFTKALKKFTHSLRAGGLWTLRSVSVLPEKYKRCGFSGRRSLYFALLVQQWTYVGVRVVPNFTHFPRESGLCTALHRCDHHASDSLLHWRLGYG